MDPAEALYIAHTDTQTRRSLIQGFTYGHRHVVRDCLRHFDEQEIFSVEAKDEHYETAHAEMMRALQVAQMAIVIEHLAQMGFSLSPSPNQ